MDVDVLVVGAGPTGLSLAAQADAHGATVRIIDRALDRAHESRALAVQPRTLEVLAASGISDELVRRGNPAVRFEMHAGNRAIELPLFDPGTRDTDFPFLLFVSQAVTEEVLDHHLAGRGVRVERGVQLTGLTWDADAGIAAVRHEGGATESIRARFVAGCDGVRSTVRQQAGIAFLGGTYPQTFALADLEVDGLAADRAHGYLADRGVMLFFPLGRPASWRMIAMRPAEGWPPPHGADPSAPTTLADLQALAADTAGSGIRLHDPVWLTDFRLQHRHADRYRAGRAFVAGDAAHVHSPAGAQGMNTGIQDAWNLGWKLALVARGVADPALLDSYDAERAPVGRLVVRFTDRAFAVATSTARVVRFLRGRVVPRVVPLAARVGPARARAFRTLAELDIGYRNSPAVQEGRPRIRGGPRAGERVPAAPVARHDTIVSLQRELGGPGFHLLLCGPPQAWDGVPAGVATHALDRTPAPGVLHDADGTAMRLLGVRAGGAAHYLVRPDGHVAYRAAGVDLSGLRAYLDRWLPGLGPPADRPPNGRPTGRT